VITENTHAENNDWQEPGGEQLSASETSQPLTTDVPAASQEQATTTDSPEASATTQEEEAAPATPAQPGEQEAQPSAEFTQVSNDEPAVAENAASVEESEAIRPFTDFIEEFRQTEERLSALLADAGPASSVFTDGSELLHEPVVLTETAAEDLTHVIDTIQSTEEQASASPLETAASTLTQETPPAERPVSPLLRPASRLRLPRHGRHRVEEPEKPVEQPQAQPESEQPAAEVVAPVAPPVEEPPARPARRYRFDRPAATASASPASAKTATPAAPASEPETKGKRGTSFAAKKEQRTHTEPAPAHASAAAETSAPKTPVQETPAASVEATPPAAAPTTERRRRNNHDRQREKEKEKEQPVTAAPAVPAPEPIVASVESVTAEETEIAIEDLPPLEYADLQAASSRRRRRRRISGVSTTAASTGASSATSKAIQPELPVNPPHPPAFASPKNVNASAPLSYNIVSGYTVSQMNQGNDVGGPFMGPEPSPARGSTFGTPTPLRHAHNEVLRSTPSHPVKHSEGGALMSSAAVNHLANAVASAIQTQTDRMVAEMRRANQVPTNVSVSLPPFPSTERVGVFVDVANLLYSARTLRMTIDFGKLLDFLRGNRRLVRAQAYCPTSPQPSDDQMFLQAVKGLGYRITTKNYKTFSSGAKKADLDLDLCMDVVRLVDGKAVDCVVLVSGDSDFMPMLDYCSDHGVRVEVAAFDESMSATLRQACDLFVNLSMLEEIRA